MKHLILLQQHDDYSDYSAYSDQRKYDYSDNSAYSYEEEKKNHQSTWLAEEFTENSLKFDGP